jgi:hypothetical protein
MVSIARLIQAESMLDSGSFFQQRIQIMAKSVIETIRQASKPELVECCNDPATGDFTGCRVRWPDGTIHWVPVTVIELLQQVSVQGLRNMPYIALYRNEATRFQFYSSAKDAAAELKKLPKYEDVQTQVRYYRNEGYYVRVVGYGWLCT